MSVKPRRWTLTRWHDGSPTIAKGAASAIPEYPKSVEVVEAHALGAAEDALWRCVELSGADTSEGRPRPGTGDWPQLAELAVREVGQLRDDYDDYTDLRRAEAAEQARDELAEALRAKISPESRPNDPPDAAA